MYANVFDIYQATGHSHRLVNLFDTIVNLYSREAWSWHILAEAWKLTGNCEKAIDVYRLGLEFIPNDYTFHKRLCDLYVVVADYHNAIECYELAMQVAPQSLLWEYVYIGAIDPDTGVRLTLDDKFYEGFLWHSVGAAYRAVGDSCRAGNIYDTVICQYQSAIQKEFNTLFIESVGFKPFTLAKFRFVRRPIPEAVLWCALGEAFRAKGDIEGSRLAIQKAKEGCPDNVWDTGIKGRKHVIVEASDPMWGISCSCQLCR
jgi:tetratricopeptide (TPR) repeat protein